MSVKYYNLKFLLTCLVINKLIKKKTKTSKTLVIFLPLSLLIGQCTLLLKVTKLTWNH